MDRQFLYEVTGAFLTSNNIIRDYPKKQRELIENQIIKDLIDLTIDLRENDIELYDMLWDRSKVFQERVLRDYLNFTYCYESKQDEVLTEGLFTTGVILGFLGTTLISGKASKAVMGTLYNIGRFFEGSGKKMVKWGRYWSFRYAIVQRNANQCYMRCKVTPEDTNMLTYLSTGSSEPFVSTPKHLKKGKCLRDCYVNYMIESIDLLCKRYFVCLKKSGDLYRLSNSNERSLEQVIGQLNLSMSCNEYFKDAQQAFSKFYDLLDFAYGADGTDAEEVKQSIIDQLRKRLIKSRNDISKSKNMKSYK